MSEERKNPVWPWVVSLLVGLPVLYVASFGPACWLVDTGRLAARPAAKFYKPLLSIDAYGATNWYAGVCCRYNPSWTRLRMIDAAGLGSPVRSGAWPDPESHDTPERSIPLIGRE
jgi:hypothetical protein